MGDRVRGVSNDGGGGELHPDRGHRGRGREQRPAHQQSGLPHSSQGGTLPSFAQQSNCIFVFSASQENVFLNKTRDVDVFVIRARDARGTRAETSINICIIFCIYFLSVENTNTTLQLQHTQNNKKNTRKCLHSFPLMEAAFHRLTFFNIFSIANGEMGFLGFKWGKLSKLFKYLHCDIVQTVTKQYLQYLHNIYKDVFVIRHH